jgi:hypothetical protein
MKTRIAVFAVGLMLVASASVLGLVLVQSFQATDFLGEWVNVKPVYKYTDYISDFEISENQGSYTISVVHRSTLLGAWGTAALTINPPNAHAFYTFQSDNQLESADLALRLLNLTSMEIKESIAFRGSSTPYLVTEQFTKYLPSCLTLTSVSWSRTMTVTSTSYVEPHAEFPVGDIADRPYSLPANTSISGSVSVTLGPTNAPGNISFMVLDAENYQKWISGQESEFVFSTEGQGQFNFTFTTASSGVYHFVFDNRASLSKKYVVLSASYSYSFVTTASRCV